MTGNSSPIPIVRAADRPSPVSSRSPYLNPGAHPDNAPVGQVGRGDQQSHSDDHREPANPAANPFCWCPPPGDRASKDVTAKATGARKTEADQPVRLLRRSAGVRFQTSHPTSERVCSPGPLLSLAESATLLPEHWYINCFRQESWLGSWIGYSRIFATAYVWFAGTRVSAP